MNDKKSVGCWWAWILILLIGTILVLTVTGVAGRIVDVVVQREVFERSFQYQESKSEQIATYQAAMAELESKLADSNLSDSVKSDIRAQLAALRIQLNSAIQMQNKTN